MRRKKKEKQKQTQEEIVKEAEEPNIGILEFERWRRRKNVIWREIKGKSKYYRKRRRD